MLRLLDLAGWIYRHWHCHAYGHTWTDRAYPPACVWCGRSSLR